MRTRDVSRIGNAHPSSMTRDSVSPRDGRTPDLREYELNLKLDKEKLNFKIANEKLN